MVEPQKFPPVHHPPRGPDIVLMPYPHTLVCPGCQLTRNLPDGWQEMLNSQTLSCTECNKVMQEVVT